MTNTDKITNIEQSYAGKDFQMLERLEAYHSFSGMEEFKNYLLILLVMIQKSQAQEGAATLLWKKIFQEQIGRNDTDPRQYGQTIINYIKELAVFPYTSIATTIGRLIATIIYDTSQQNTRHITTVITCEQLLNINEFFLQKHISQHDLDNDFLTLSYNCIATIEPNTLRIFISDRARRIVRAWIDFEQFENYLTYFIRPYYTAMSNYATLEARYHVPEPFYEQFFNSYEQFVEFIGRPTIGPSTLRGEIWEFMHKYKQNLDRGLPYVDIGPLELTRKLHKNVRFEY